MLPKGNCSTDLCFLSRPLSLAGAGVSVFFVTTKVLSRQKYVCHDKHCFVATTLSSQPTGVCRAFVATKLCLLLQNSCHNKHYFVVTSILLSWQKTCFVFVAINAFVAAKLLSHMRLWLNACSFTQCIWKIPPKSLKCCLVVTWLVPCETAVVLVQVLCRRYKLHTSLQCHFIWSYVHSICLSVGKMTRICYVLLQ